MYIVPAESDVYWLHWVKIIRLSTVNTTTNPRVGARTSDLRVEIEASTKRAGRESETNELSLAGLEIACIT